MIHHKRVVQGIVTGLILVPILITAFLPGRMAKTQAASDPADSSSVDHSTTAAIIPSSPVQPSAAPLPASSRRHVTSTRAVPLTRTDTSVVLMPDASAAYAPSATQTSSFLSVFSAAAGRRRHDGSLAAFDPPAIPRSLCP